MAHRPINFVSLLNGMAEELNLPPPTYHPGLPGAVGTHNAIVRFGNATASGSGSDIRAARNAAA